MSHTFDIIAESVLTTGSSNISKGDTYTFIIYEKKYIKKKTFISVVYPQFATEMYTSYIVLRSTANGLIAN